MGELMKWVEPDPKRENWFWPTDRMKERAWVSDPKVYEESWADPIAFWEKRAEEITWFKKWDKVYEEEPYKYRWFIGGKLNLSYNSLDRHVEAGNCLLYTSPSPRDLSTSRMPSSA